LYNANGIQVLKTNGTTISDSTNGRVEDDDSGPLNGSLLKYTLQFRARITFPPVAMSHQFGAGSTGQYLLTMNDGGTPYSPTVSLTDVADYLSNSYWEVNGVAPAKWNLTAITYRVTGLEPERQALARIAFQAWADVTGLTFTEITSGTAKITLDDTTANAAFENSSYSGGFISSATINVSSDWYGGIDAIDSYTLQTFTHEIGHALGLGHGGPYNGSATYGVDNVYANDSWHLSVMSYMDQIDAGTGSYRFIMTPEMADILAVQRYYGTPNTRPGDTVYGFGSNAGFTVASGSGTQNVNLYDFASYTQAPAFTIYDGNGTDILNASGYSNNQLIDLRGGNFSNIGGLTGNIGIYTTTVIENAVGGSGADTIIGNGADNMLTGNAGNDVISGGAGSDTLIGGAGRDTLDGGAGFDIASWIPESSGLTLNLANQALNAGSATATP
jgi:serralysin